MSPVKESNSVLWWNGLDYKEHSTAQSYLANSILEQFTFRKDGLVLDLGCGNGEITQGIGEDKIPYGKIIGLDPSSSMIQVAKGTNKQKNVDFIVGYAENFYFSETFDYIVSFSALHWIPDQQKVWENIRRHLKPQGQAIVSLNPLPRSQQLTEALIGAMQDIQFMEYFQHFEEKILMPEMTIDQYREIIIETGLKIVKCEQSTKHFEYEDHEAFASSLRAWLPHMSQLPEDLKTNFLNLIVSKFNHPRLDYNHFMIHAERIN